MESQIIQLHDELLSIVKENQRLLIENNTILKKQEKRAVRGFWLKIVWFAILIGLPIILLPYLMSTLMGSIGLQGNSSDTNMSQTLKNAQETLRQLQNP